jgi:hypothetical protein
MRGIVLKMTGCKLSLYYCTTFHNKFNGEFHLISKMEDVWC